MSRSALLTLAVLLAAAGNATAQQLGAPWDSIGVILKAPGVKNPDHYRYTFPRRDITLKLGDVTVAPALALGSWVAFTGAASAARVMGDLVLLPDELPAVTTELKNQQIDITAIHNHLVGSTPAILYVHVHGTGSALQLAQAIDRVLARTATPRPVAASAAGPLGIDTALIFRTLGKSGKGQGKVAQLSFNLVPGVVRMHGEVVPAGPGYATPINIQMVDSTRAVATGDFAITGAHTQAVLLALTKHGITPTAMHTHLIDEMPRIYYIHFWADGPLPDVLSGLKAALEAAR